MPRLLPLLALAAAWLSAGGAVQAQTPTPDFPPVQGFEMTNGNAAASAEQPSDYLPTDSGLGIPSGLLGLGIGQPSAFQQPLPSTAPEVSEIQGCGTVGVDDYTGQLYNNPDVFQKFSQTDVNSDLARQLLTYNYSMPQTAALFAQLNQFGNDRYRQFQQGCALTSQQADARRQYVRECVSTILSSGAIVDASLMGSGPSATTPPAEELKARKTARAYELCTQQYNSYTRNLLQQKSESYAESVRRAQDVNRMLRPLLCPNIPPLGGNGVSPQAAACWPNLFLPQVRLMAEGVKSTSPQTDFGVQSAPLTVSTFLDGLRSAVGGDFMTKVLTPFRQSITVTDPNTLAQAAEVAARALGSSAANIGVNSNPANANNPPLADNRRAFVIDYLNCKNPDITLALQEYGNALRQVGVQDVQGPTQGGTPLGLTPATFGANDYQPIADRMFANSNINDPAIQADRTDLPRLMEVAAGCATNQQIPFLDPMVLAHLSSCQTDDQNAFFSMAAYDVAVTATRNVLNYTKSQLQTVLGRLEAGDQTSLQALQTNNSIPDSPAIREKLATAVRTIMLPHLEQQLARLNQFEASRGAFGQRVSAVYQQKVRCLFND